MFSSSYALAKKALIRVRSADGMLPPQIKDYSSLVQSASIIAFNAIVLNNVRRFSRTSTMVMSGDATRMVTLGMLSPRNNADVLAMRRKLRAVGQRLGCSSARATRLAAAASDHAKRVIRSTSLEVLIGLSGSGEGQELSVEFVGTHLEGDTLLQAGFDRVEPLIDGRRRGLRASCNIDPIAPDNPTVSLCQATIAEQNVEEVVEALHMLVERYRNSRDRGAGHSGRLGE